MIALEVRVNGKLITRAGSEDLYVLNALIDAMGTLGKFTNPNKAFLDRHSIHLDVTGVTKGDADKFGSQINWIPTQEIHIGDEISIKVVETDIVDTPCKIRQHQQKQLDNKSRWNAAREFYLEHKQDYEN